MLLHPNDEDMEAGPDAPSLGARRFYAQIGRKMRKRIRPLSNLEHVKKGTNTLNKERIILAMIRPRLLEQFKLGWQIVFNQK